MRRKVEPLLCELHAHTRWSDGAFTVPELVDLYGRNGFDVLCVTDHVNRSDDPWLPPTRRARRPRGEPRATTSPRSRRRPSAPGASTTCCSCPGSS